MDKVERCGFCGKVREEGTIMVQSPLDPAAIICKSCILFFKEKQDDQSLEKFEDEYRPDESQTD